MYSIQSQAYPVSEDWPHEEQDWEQDDPPYEEGMDGMYNANYDDGDDNMNYNDPDYGYEPEYPDADDAQDQMEGDPDADDGYYGGEDDGQEDWQPEQDGNDQWQFPGDYDTPRFRDCTNIQQDNDQNDGQDDTHPDQPYPDEQYPDHAVQPDPPVQNGQNHAQEQTHQGSESQQPPDGEQHQGGSQPLPQNGQQAANQQPGSQDGHQPADQQPNSQHGSHPQPAPPPPPPPAEPPAGGGGHAQPASPQSYTGPSSSFPPSSKWVQFEDMWQINEPTITQKQASGQTNTPQQVQFIKQAILQVAKESGVDERVILGVMMQESNGDVHAGSTSSADGVGNPGLMQSHQGVSFKEQDQQGSILQMIRDGVTGTKAGDGIKQCIEHQGGDVFAGVREYNSGSNAVHKENLSDVTANGSGHFGVTSYASDIANRLMGVPSDKIKTVQ